MDIITITAALFVLALVLMYLTKWRDARREARYWSLPVHTRVKWHQISDTTFGWRGMGGPKMVPTKKKMITSTAGAHHIWCDDNCKKLKDELDRHGYDVHRKMPVGDGKIAKGYLSVIVKRKQLFNVKYPEGFSSETRSYILQFGPEAVLDIEEAVKTEFRRWGIRTKIL